MKKLAELKEKMLRENTNPSLLKSINSMCVDRNKPLGKFNIWAFWIEFVRGCNLSCWHCPVRLFPKGEYHFMSKDTWIALINVVKELTPNGKIVFANAGEPLLHPNILEFISLAKEICPTLTITSYTNGINLINKKISYRELFSAGLDGIYVDMYHAIEQHKELAQESGYFWMDNENKPCNSPNVFGVKKGRKKGQEKIIVLARSPGDWSIKRVKRVNLCTFLNNLDWEAAIPKGINPVTKAPDRRCDQPFKLLNVNFDGTFPFCCMDFNRLTNNKFGNISGGVESVFDFWFSRYMQDTRKKLLNKNRNSHEWCRTCAYTGGRGDIPYWGYVLKENEQKELTDFYWANNSWKSL